MPRTTTETTVFGARSDIVVSSFDPATPWLARDVWLSDEYMAYAGWIPVIEQTPTD